MRNFCVVKCTWLQIRLTCKADGCCGQKLLPAMLTGRPYASKDNHSSSSDQTPDEERNGMPSTKVGISLMPGSTRQRSARASENQAVCMWWCAMNARCLQDPTGALASFKNKPTRCTLQEITLVGKPIRTDTAALGDRPPTCKRRRHHFRSLPWNA